MFPVAAAAHLADATEGRKAWLWLTVEGTQSIAMGRQEWWGSKSCSMLSTWKERAQIRKWGHSSRPQVLPPLTVAHFPPEAYLRKFLQPPKQHRLLETQGSNALTLGAHYQPPWDTTS